MTTDFRLLPMSQLSDHVALIHNVRISALALASAFMCMFVVATTVSRGHSRTHNWEACARCVLSKCASVRISHLVVCLFVSSMFVASLMLPVDAVAASAAVAAAAFAAINVFVSVVVLS